MKAGCQPMINAATTKINSWPRTMMVTAKALPARRPGLPSGVAASRSSTPYRRSNPVVMATEVNAEDHSARPSTEGARLSKSANRPPKK